KIFPWLVAGITILVAVIVTAVRSQTGVVVLNYIQFDDAMSWLVIFFVAICAPELVSRDLRSGVLPLYFSRPLRAADYVIAKVACTKTASGGVGTWLIHTPRSAIDIGSYGPVYAVEAVTIGLACMLLLLARYRKVASL